VIPSKAFKGALNKKTFPRFSIRLIPLSLASPREVHGPVMKKPSLESFASQTGPPDHMRRKILSNTGNNGQRTSEREVKTQPDAARRGKRFLGRKL